MGVFVGVDARTHTRAQGALKGSLNADKEGRVSLWCVCVCARGIVGTVAQRCRWGYGLTEATPSVHEAEAENT